MSSNNSKYGQSSLYSVLRGNKNFFAKLNNNPNLGNLQSVRVMSIVLDETHPRF